MRTHLPRLLGSFAVFLAIHASAAIHYVDLNSTNATPPYTDWSTAATNIQDAIDASTNGDIVLVTNGVYDSGGVSIAGGTTNRVAITNEITVQSVNGPWVTIIEGVSATTGRTSVRCAWLTNNATLSGFTLTSGSTTSSDGNGGAVYCAASSNCFVDNCVIVSNSASSIGAAIYQGRINNCLISGNGGRAPSATYESILNNCTVVSNNVSGVTGGFLTNCIDYYNANNNGNPVAAAYCCTTPLPSGKGNFANAPQLFADGVHFLPTSPCIGAGTNLVTGTDIFGLAWSNPPSVGCAEYNPAPLVTQPTIVLTGNPAGFAINVAATGSPPVSFYWLQDGVPLQDNGLFADTQTTNLVAGSVSFADAGDYQFVVSNAFGVITSAVTTLNIHCVDVAGTNPEPPYLTWATAATNIQDAINGSENGDIVLVTNGIYSSGTQSEDGVSSNRVTLNKAIRVQSVNGPWVTTIQGAGATNGTSAVRCAWLTNNAALVGFTLKWGATQTTGTASNSESGGGVWCASSNGVVVDNCVIVSNTTDSHGVVYQGMVNNCLISSNSAGGGSVAVYGAFVNSCTIMSNTTFGGAMTCTLTNCIIYYNRNNFESPVSAAYCCTTPAIAGPGNFTNAPDFQSGGIHLASGSPCIGAGTNVVIGTDIFGVAWANPPSVGCAEYNALPTVTEPQLTFTSGGFQIGNIVVESQPPFGFQWFENGVALQDSGNFSGTQTANLVVTGVNLAEAGSYQLVVTNAFGAVTSAVVPLAIHVVDLASTNPQPPFLTWGTAATNIQDAIEAALSGDIVLVTNGIYSSGGETIGGLTNRVALDRAVMVASVNGYKATVIQGAWDPVSTNGPAAIRCAWLTNGAVLTGFTLEDGATESTGVQTNSQSGGGAWCASTNALVSNCLLTNNFANYGGGGIAFGTLNNSLVVLNVAAYGGGAYEATLNNCTVQNNFTTAGEGGGTYEGSPQGFLVGLTRNSIVVGNMTRYPDGVEMPNDYWASGGGSSYSYCCTEGSFSGQILLGSSNILVDPLLLDWYHISIYSPCRGAGSPLYASGTDLDGEPWNNPPSIGCDEVVVADRTGPLSVTLETEQTNVLVSSPSYLHVDGFVGLINGLAIYASWDFGDGTGITNASNVVQHDWTNAGDYTVAFTAYNIENPLGVSASQVIQVIPVNPPQLLSAAIVSNNFEFQFSMQESGNYTVQYATNLTPPVAWVTLQSIPFSLGGAQQVQDSAPTNAARFYRVLAQ